MGKVAVVRHSEAEITLSMVRWGRVRRLALFWGKKLGIINRFYIALFVPKYEIAVYEGGPKVVFSRKPVYIFYYPDTVTALRKWDELASILAREGLFGTVDFIRTGEPREQGLMSNFNFEERLNRLFQ
jgi:hypothetical protein